jgi:hypothetical protein
MSAMARAATQTDRRLAAVRLADSPVALWIAFGAVHGVLVLLCFVSTGWPLGDIERVYRSWAEAAASGQFVVGITTPFVYPVLAFVPVMLAYGFGPDWYPQVWLAMVTVLNAAALACLIGEGRSVRRVAAAWWWLAFLLVLGPIALPRIDSVTVPLVMMALLWLRTRPLWATALLALATWVKVWPVAVIAALVVASRSRWRILGAAAGTSALVVVVALAAGSGVNVFSFITQQTGRGIQIESPVAAFWLWQAAAGVPGSEVYYDREILTFQVAGAGVDAAAWLMTPLMALAVAGILALGWRATRRGRAVNIVLPPLVLALVATLVAFNKVGSPQFITWFAAPVILGIVVCAREWRLPAALVMAMAALTHVVYPHLYSRLLEADPWLVLALSARNLLEFVVLGWAASRLWSVGSAAPAMTDERSIQPALTVKE